MKRNKKKVVKDIDVPPTVPSVKYQAQRECIEKKQVEDSEYYDGMEAPECNEDVYELTD